MGNNAAMPSATAMPVRREDCSMLARTSQSSAIKTLLETLKDLLEDVAFEFDHDGVRLVATDNTHIAMIHLRLDASRFDEFWCPQPVTVGVNVPCLHKLVRSIGNSDTLALFLDDDAAPGGEMGAPTQLGIRVENHERRASTTFRLGLLDLPQTAIEVPPVSFESCVVLPSTDLQKIIRDMAAISDRVEITSAPTHLSLACAGDFCSQETVLEEKDTDGADGVAAQTGAVIIQGVFSLKYLVLFCKCSGLCSSVKINLKNDYPVVFNYSVASLGDLKLCLSPMCE